MIKVVTSLHTELRGKNIDPYFTGMSVSHTVRRAYRVGYIWRGGHLWIMPPAFPEFCFKADAYRDVLHGTKTS